MNKIRRTPRLAWILAVLGASALLALPKSACAQPIPTEIAQDPERQSELVLPLKDIDFRQNEDGTGRIIFSLSHSAVNVGITQQGPEVMVDLKKTSLPEGISRRRDVSDLLTPVQRITTTQIGDRVHVVIESKGLWVQSAYQTGDQYVVEIRPVKPDAANLVPKTAFTGEKMTLNFQDIEARSLLNVIADFTSLNIVTSDSVKGLLTLRLNQVPWDQALDVILQAKGLDMRKTGNVIWVAPKEEIIAKEKMELEARVAFLNLEPVTTQSFQMNFAKAAEVATLLTGTGGSMGVGFGEKSPGRTLSARGSAVADQRTNQVFVTDVPSRLEQALQLIQKLDVSVRQVMIEVRIVEASDTFGKSLGVKFGATDQRAQKGGDGGFPVVGGSRVAFGNNYANVVAASGGGGIDENISALKTTSGNFVNMPAVGMGLGTPATFAVSLFSAMSNRFLNLEISALEADSKGKLVSSPRVVTADGKKASITQGEKIPYTVCTDASATTTASCRVDFKSAALNLVVTPQVTPDGTIIMDLDVSKDSRGQDTLSSGPVILTKNIATQVLVDNGGTVLIGGIFELEESSDESKVPWFGDLPAVGNLFKNKTRTQRKKELLVFVTPRLIDTKTGR
jgi:type IV pilus assembly protein PilQ